MEPLLLLLLVLLLPLLEVGRKPSSSSSSSLSWSSLRLLEDDEEEEEEEDLVKPRPDQPLLELRDSSRAIRKCSVATRGEAVARGKGRASARGLGGKRRGAHLVLEGDEEEDSVAPEGSLLASVLSSLLPGFGGVMLGMREGWGLPARTATMAMLSCAPPRVRAKVDNNSRIDRGLIARPQVRSPALSRRRSIHDASLRTLSPEAAAVAAASSAAASVLVISLAAGRASAGEGVRPVTPAHADEEDEEEDSFLGAASFDEEDEDEDDDSFLGADCTRVERWEENRQGRCGRPCLGGALSALQRVRVQRGLAFMASSTSLGGGAALDSAFFLSCGVGRRRGRHVEEA